MNDRYEGPVTEQWAGWQAAQLLWNVGGAADPHLNRPFMTDLIVNTMTGEEARATLSAALEMFGMLGQARPDVVVPFLGELLNMVEPEEPYKGG